MNTCADGYFWKFHSSPAYELTCGFLNLPSRPTPCPPRYFRSPPSKLRGVAFAQSLNKPSRAWLYSFRYSSVDGIAGYVICIRVFVPRISPNLLSICLPRCVGGGCSLSTVQLYRTLIFFTTRCFSMFPPRREVPSKPIHITVLAHSVSFCHARFAERRPANLFPLVPSPSNS